MVSDFIFKPYKEGYLHILGSGKVIFYDRKKMEQIHQCCHELESRPLFPEGFSPRDCIHRIGTAHANSIYCDLFENSDHTWFRLCNEMRFTGRCHGP